MFLMHRPSDREIDAFISALGRSHFSYGPPGITRDAPPSGFNTDHNRARLGSGAETFSAAVAALQRWKMFDMGWLRLFRDDAPIEPGSTVAVVVKHLGFWSMNGCRIVYVVEESGARERYGFAYGTLAEHAERGEERFLVEWDREDDTVWYDILALSKPGPMARLAYPYARALQRRFATDSKMAMVRAVRGRDESTAPRFT